MAFRLLFDEMTEARIVRYCAKLGHDVERVVSVSELGAGSDDTDIVAYADRTDRILLTYDGDFLGQQRAQSQIGILFGPDDRSPPLRTANVIDAIADHLEQQEVIDHGEPVHLSEEWL